MPVLRALRRGAGGRVILVDDGGNRGLRRCRRAGALIVAGPSLGKAEAMRAGLAFVRTDRVIFADADIVGFNAGHARLLADFPGPGQLCGLRENGSRLLGPMPPITGERNLAADVAGVALAGARGYEAELAINAEIGRRGLPAHTVVLAGVRNPSKAPVRRTVQLLAAAARHILGLAQYAVSWLVTLLAD